MSPILVLIYLLANGAVAAPATARLASCLPYEPDTVQVSGTLARRMYYGAPNYGEDTATDEKEPGFYLELSASICTVGRAPPNDSRQNVRLVQLVLDSAGYAQLRPYLGRKITLRGTLFGSFSGHHHAPLLLRVEKPVRPVVGM